MHLPACRPINVVLVTKLALGLCLKRWQPYSSASSRSISNCKFLHTVQIGRAKRCKFVPENDELELKLKCDVRAIRISIVVLPSSNSISNSVSRTKQFILERIWHNPLDCPTIPCKACYINDGGQDEEAWEARGCEPIHSALNPPTASR